MRPDQELTPKNPPSSPSPLPSLPLSGPTGLGTAAARIRPGTEPEPATEPEPGPASPAVRVPELYCPDAVRDDPALAADVNDRLVAWAEEIGVYEGRIDRLRSHDFGRLMMLAAGGGRQMRPVGVGRGRPLGGRGRARRPRTDRQPPGAGPGRGRPVRMPARYVLQFEEIVQQEPVLRAFRSSLNYLARYASWTQVARLRHELAVMFVGYGQEAQWRTSGRTPAVWEYLLHRYENAFFP